MYITYVEPGFFILLTLGTKPTALGTFFLHKFLLVHAVIFNGGFLGALICVVRVVFAN